MLAINDYPVWSPLTFDQVREAFINHAVNDNVREELIKLLRELKEESLTIFGNIPYFEFSLNVPEILAVFAMTVPTGDVFKEGDDIASRDIFNMDIRIVISLDGKLLSIAKA
jgi:hypothetical protein